MSKIGNCYRCGKEFTINPKAHGRHIYCSYRCGQYAATKRYNDKKKSLRIITPKPILSKECVICGKSFNTIYPTSKFCSVKCRRTNDNRRGGNKIKSYIPKQPCEICGFSDLRAIHRHHIDPEQGNNGGVICLCANHHYIYHSIIGWNGTSEHKTRQEVLSIVREGVQGKEVP